QLRPSPLRPHCRAEERIFLWRGCNSPPTATLANPLLRHLADIASHVSLSDTTGYGSGLRKFHIFCDIFSVPETDRLPAPFHVLHSFALWAATDPDPNNPIFADGTPFEPVSVVVVKKYLSAIRAWHLAQGWAPPLSEGDHERISWSLRSLSQVQAGLRTRPPRPPITLNMLSALKAILDLSDSFDACVWAAASCAFWGMMRFGEVSVHSRSAFQAADRDSKPYTTLNLPSAKTAKPGEVQQIFLTTQGSLCPLEALQNMAQVTLAGPDDPLFFWHDRHGDIRPLVKGAAIDRINAIFQACRWGTSFGHSFRIGGASFFLSEKVDPEIVRLAGRWKSMAYETYIRAFE
ncbi:hypothetical protein BKA93DRAFT_694135, partial [Sparassis latifolia]